MAGIPINSSEMLLQVLGADMVKVIDDVAKWIVMQIKISIMSNVYNYPPSEDYVRLAEDGGFLGAWEQEATTFAGNYISAKIGMNPDLMDYNPEEYQHGNSGEDRRDRLDEYIAMGSGYDFGGNASMKRDYWSPIEQMVDDGSLDETLEWAFRKNGISFLRVG